MAMCVFHTAFALVTLGVGNLDLGVPLYGTDLEFWEKPDNNTDHTVPNFELPSTTRDGSARFR